MLSVVPATRAQPRAGVASPLVHSTQLLVVTTPGWDSVNGTVQRYERRMPAADWHRVGDPVPVVVGESGMGWGIGLTPLANHEVADPEKHEGDRKSPAGIFRLGSSFGFAPTRPEGWTIPYRALSPATECVDDPQSKSYNRVVDRKAVASDWNSSEHMLAVGEYYRWGLVIDQNPANSPAAGSCVFLHIWGNDGSGTAGCTAMAQPQIEALLAWLRPTAAPLLGSPPIRRSTI